MDHPISTIVLLTDFGLADPYVGQMKGVLANSAPRARVVDLSHGVEPYRVAQAAFFLRASAEYFPPGSIFVCVVDPGVGSERKVLLAQCGQSFFLAPDNGLLSLLLSDTTGDVRLFDVSPSVAPASATFHGRDLFAPLAARLAAGAKPEELGRELDPTTLLRGSWAEPRMEGGSIVASVLHADRFGNLVLNLPAASWSPRLRVGGQIRVQSGAGRSMGFGQPGPSRHAARVVTHYAELAPNELGILVGSQGYMEMAMNQASAAKSIGLGLEAEVTLELPAGSR
jgi:S-adenosylmethionine hydrolase